MSDYVAAGSCGYCQVGKHERCNGRAYSITPPRSENRDRAVVIPGIGSVPLTVDCYCSLEIRSDPTTPGKSAHQGGTAGAYLSERVRRAGGKT